MVQIAISEGLKLSEVEACDRCRIGRRPGLLEGAELEREARNIGKLARTLHLGVAGENLLQQVEPGARQADDEDRIRRGIAAAGAGGEKRRSCTARTRAR